MGAQETAPEERREAGEGAPCFCHRRRTPRTACQQAGQDPEQGCAGGTARASTSGLTCSMPPAHTCALHKTVMQCHSLRMRRWCSWKGMEGTSTSAPAMTWRSWVRSPAMLGHLYGALGPGGNSVRKAARLAKRLKRCQGPDTADPGKSGPNCALACKEPQRRMTGAAALALQRPQSRCMTCHWTRSLPARMELK